LLAALRDAGRKILVKAETVARKAEQPMRPALVEATGQSTARVILTHARKVHADLIVLGTHGRRGLKRLVMGSDAEAVLREATVPVLLLRSSKRHRVSRELTQRRRGNRQASHSADAAGSTSCWHSRRCSLRSGVCFDDVRCAVGMRCKYLQL
jgi:hypothetical protein